jgi:hypothetical protein
MDTCALIEKLDDWHRSVPRDVQTHDKSTPTTAYARHISVCLLYRYHEAYLAILDISGRTSSPSNPPARATEKPRSAIIFSIREIFAASNKIDDILYDK